MMKIWVLLLLVSVASAQQNCPLAQTLKAAGMDGFRGVTLANWVCMAFAESRYNTQAINHNSDRSTDYGIFQINNRWWCYDGQFPSHNICRVSCSQLLSGISASIACAKTIVSQQGMKAWVGWRAKCENQDVSKYIKGCVL